MGEVVRCRDMYNYVYTHIEEIEENWIDELRKYKFKNLHVLGINTLVLSKY